MNVSDGLTIVRGSHVHAPCAELVFNQDKSVYASTIWIQPSAINKAAPVFFKVPCSVHKTYRSMQLYLKNYFQVGICSAEAIVSSSQR